MITVVDAPILGERETVAFVTRAGRCGGVERMVTLVRPPSPNGDRLREVRTRLGLSLGQAADALGLRPSELSGLELGAKVPVGERAWDRIFAALAAAASEEP